MSVNLKASASSEARLGGRQPLAFVLTLPIEVITTGQLNLCVDLFSRFLDSAAQVTSVHACRKFVTLGRCSKCAVAG